MSQSSSWYFERLFHWGNSPNTKLAFIIENLLFEYTILGIPDTFRRRSSEFKYRPCWHSVVGGDKDGELLYMAPWSPLCCIETKTKTQHLLTWTRFIVLTSNQKPLAKISPFIIEKTIKGCAGEVKNVTKLRSGSLMIECFWKQQSLNLLALKHVNDITAQNSQQQSWNHSL
jgi:hypothetical protein